MRGLPLPIDYLEGRGFPRPAGGGKPRPYDYLSGSRFYRRPSTSFMS
jgi:hypothetical protein